jgi:hypothetical protein
MRLLLVAVTAVLTIFAIQRSRRLLLRAIQMTRNRPDPSPTFEESLGDVFPGVTERSSDDIEFRFTVHN